MQKSRTEDRRSCHNLSLILGLAVAGGHYQVAVAAFETMLMLVTPVSGQKAN